jgi:hypothetical protein
VDVFGQEPKLFSCDLNQHIVIALTVVHNTGHDGGLPIFVELDKALGTAADPHGETGLDGIGSDPYPVIRGQFTEFFLPIGCLCCLMNGFIHGAGAYIGLGAGIFPRLA